MSSALQRRRGRCVEQPLHGGVEQAAPRERVAHARLRAARPREARDPIYGSERGGSVQRRHATKPPRERRHCRRSSSHEHLDGFQIGDAVNSGIQASISTVGYKLTSAEGISSRVLQLSS